MKTDEFARASAWRLSPSTCCNMPLHAAAVALGLLLLYASLPQMEVHSLLFPLDHVLRDLSHRLWQLHCRAQGLGNAASNHCKLGAHG